MTQYAVIFPGQGSQSVGMGKDVAASSEAAAAVFRRADEIVGFELSRSCFEGPESELARTDIQQPAIFVTSVAIWRALIDRGASEEALLGATAGLSLGEYTALHVAGCLEFDDALRLVRRRGELMQEAAESSPGAMVSIIGGAPAAVEALCVDAAEGEVLGTANFNCPGQIVISGTRPACERAVARASKHGVRAILLKVAGAFHSSLMTHAAEELGAVLSTSQVSSPSACPVMANVDARAHLDAESVREKLRLQMTHAVRWQETIEHLIERGFDCFVEVGPGRVLTGLMRKINRGVRAVNVSTADGLDIEALMSPSSGG